MDDFKVVLPGHRHHMEVQVATHLNFEKVAVDFMVVFLDHHYMEDDYYIARNSCRRGSYCRAATRAKPASPEASIQRESTSPSCHRCTGEVVQCWSFVLVD